MNSISLSELTLDNIEQWPKPIKWGAVLCFMIIIIGLGYWFLISPNREKLASLQTEETTLRADFENKESKASNLEAYKKQLTEIQERFGFLLKQLPTESEMPGLLEEISKTGVASGLKFELFAPQAAVTHDFNIELPIKIKVVGTYNQLAIFLSRIAGMSRIVTLHDFVIEGYSTPNPSGTPAPPEAEKKLVMDITAKIYWYRTR